jgi:hypothetical protein
MPAHSAGIIFLNRFQNIFNQKFHIELIQTLQFGIRLLINLRNFCF